MQHTLFVACCVLALTCCAAQQCWAPVDVVVIVDVSQNVAAYQNQIVEFSRQLISNYTSYDARLAIVGFDNQCHKPLPLTARAAPDSAQQIEQGLANLQALFGVASTDVDIGAGLSCANDIMHLNKTERRLPIYIVVTSGYETLSFNSKAKADEAKAMGVLVFVHAMSVTPNWDTIHGIANTPYDKFTNPTYSYDYLVTLASATADRSCFELDYVTPSTVCRSPYYTNVVLYGRSLDLTHGYNLSVHLTNWAGTIKFPTSSYMATMVTFAIYSGQLPTNDVYKIRLAYEDGQGNVIFQTVDGYTTVTASDCDSSSSSSTGAPGPQPVPETCSAPTDVVMILDTSVNANNHMQEIVDFCHGVVGNFTHPDSRFAIVGFDATAQTVLSLTKKSDASAIEAGIQKLFAWISQTGTDIGLGLQLANQELTSQPGSHTRIYILVTQGVDTGSSSADQARIARSMGVMLHVVAMGATPYWPTIETLVNGPKFQHEMNTYDRLAASGGDVVRTSCFTLESVSPTQFCRSSYASFYFQGKNLNIMNGVNMSCVFTDVWGYKVKASYTWITEYSAGCSLYSYQLMAGNWEMQVVHGDPASLSYDFFTNNVTVQAQDCEQSSSGGPGPQPTTEPCDADVDLMFIVETSMWADIPAITSFCRGVMSNYTGRNTRFGLVRFEFGAQTLLPLTPASDTATIEAALAVLSGITPWGNESYIGTALQAANIEMQAHGNAENTRMYVTVTFGANTGGADPYTMAQQARDMGVMLFVEAMSSSHLDMINAISSGSKFVRYPYTFSALSTTEIPAFLSASCFKLDYVTPTEYCSNTYGYAYLYGKNLAITDGQNMSCLLTDMWGTKKIKPYTWISQWSSGCSIDPAVVPIGRWQLSVVHGPTDSLSYDFHTSKNVTINMKDCGPGPQPVVEPCTADVDMVFIVDSSYYGKVGASAQFIRYAIGNYTSPESRFAIVRYDDTTDLIMNFTAASDKATIEQALFVLSSYSSMSISPKLGGGIQMANNVMATRDRVNTRVYVLISNGYTQDMQVILDESKKARDVLGVMFHVEAMSTQFVDTITQIASGPKFIRYVTSYDVLADDVAGWVPKSCFRIDSRWPETICYDQYSYVYLNGKNLDIAGGNMSCIFTDVWGYSVKTYAWQNYYTTTCNLNSYQLSHTGKWSIKLVHGDPASPSYDFWTSQNFTIDTMSCGGQPSSSTGSSESSSTGWVPPIPVSSSTGPQPEPTPQTCAAAVDMVLIVDTSTNANIADTVTFCRGLIANYTNPASRFAILRYDTNAQILLDLTSNVQDIEIALQNLSTIATSSGSTAIGTALQTANTVMQAQGNAVNTRMYVMIVTTGADTGYVPAAAQAEAARNMGVMIYVEVINSLTLDIINGIASGPKFIRRMYTYYNLARDVSGFIQAGCFWLDYVTPTEFCTNSYNYAYLYGKNLDITDGQNMSCLFTDVWGTKHKTYTWITGYSSGCAVDTAYITPGKWSLALVHGPPDSLAYDFHTSANISITMRDCPEPEPIPEPCVADSDVVIIVDSSFFGDVVASAEFAHSVIVNFTSSASRFAIVRYDQTADVLLPFTLHSDQQAIEQALFTLKSYTAHSTSPSIGLGLEAANNITRSRTKKTNTLIYVLITDGYDAGALPTIEQAQMARAMGAMLHVEAMTASPHMDIINAIATGKKFIRYVTNYADLPNEAGKWIAHACFKLDWVYPMSFCYDQMTTMYVYGKGFDLDPTNMTCLFTDTWGYQVKSYAWTGSYTTTCYLNPYTLTHAGPWNVQMAHIPFGSQTYDYASSQNITLDVTWCGGAASSSTGSPQPPLDSSSTAPQPEQSSSTGPLPPTPSSTGPQPLESSSTASPQPAESSSTAPQPVESSSTAPQPVESSSTAPQPVESSSTAPQPVESSSTAPQPVESSSTAPQPMESSSTAPQPVESSSTAPQPLESSSTAPQPFESSSTGPQPVESSSTAPQPIESSSTASPQPVVSSSTAEPQPVVSSSTAPQPPTPSSSTGPGPIPPPGPGGLCDEAANVFFIVDMSASVTADKKDATVMFVTYAIGNFTNDNAQFAIVAMNLADGKVVMPMTLNSDHTKILAGLRALNTMATGGQTNIGVAIAKANTLFQQSMDKRMTKYIVVTDGMENQGYYAVDAANDARKLGALVFVEAMTAQPDMEVIYGIANKPSARFVRRVLYSDLPSRASVSSLGSCFSLREVHPFTTCTSEVAIQLSVYGNGFNLTGHSTSGMLCAVNGVKSRELTYAANVISDTFAQCFIDPYAMGVGLWTLQIVQPSSVFSDVEYRSAANPAVRIDVQDCSQHSSTGGSTGGPGPQPSNEGTPGGIVAVEVILPILGVAILGWVLYRFWWVKRGMYRRQLDDASGATLEPIGSTMPSIHETMRSSLLDNAAPTGGSTGVAIPPSTSASGSGLGSMPTNARHTP